MTAKTHDPRAATNPLFGDNRLKLGIFTFNGVGMGTTNLTPRSVTWPAMLSVAQRADQAGFEALVPYARWKGVPRPPSMPFVPHEVFEPFTWAAGLAQATSYSAIFSTVTMPMIHPIVAAKMAATIDHISGGRFALNIVAGWNAPEFAMFGSPLKEHGERYQQATEWIEIIRSLWTEREFDFAGSVYKVEKGESFPKPLQAPYPPIMNAGGSDTGRAFAAKYADMCFVMAGGDGDLDAAAEQVAAYRAQALNEYGREILVWTNAQIVLRATQHEAEAYQAHLQANSNQAVMEAIRKQREANVGALTLAGGKQVKTLNASYTIVGDAEHVNAELHRLSDAGFDGVVLVAHDFDDMLDRWISSVLPLMERDGLRAPRLAA